ncbi:class I SAM-dependent methyltransferase [Sulfurivermis fontis]|uniref:class I SAM-dependent methyltransferase n=1 Tax=Sulfurivermis fontis TaxID=1972068 RepID=UPI001E2D47F4|nr:SAM-dependent methyltransferase [Sulfurivermis fontis]
MSDSPDLRQVARSLRELPPPSADEAAHSAALIQHIGKEISAAGGAISFARYMELALYAPGLGYYSAGARKFGADGDFVTAPELSPLFSRCVARHCAALLSALDGGEVMEFGAGSGVMAADILLELERMQALPPRYAILEVSADLRERQRQTLAARAPYLLERVRWLDALPEQFVGVVLGNEVLDALPVQRFRWRDGRVHELGVRWSGEAFVWCELPVCSPRLEVRVREIAATGALPEGYESEVNFAAEDWLRSLAAMLQRGVAVLFDYGFPRHEYYHPQRSGGTLMCHYRHRSHPDPLILPGLQDITAHVDFSAMAAAALDAGLDVLGFANQANYLIGSGLLELAQEAGDVRGQLEVAAQLKRLMLPGEMGELFKVLAVGRGVADGGAGFAVRDERYRL